MTRIESAEKITNAMRILEKEKGNKVFTAREYKQLGKDMPSLQTLRDKYLIKVNSSETFAKIFQILHPNAIFIIIKNK